MSWVGVLKKRRLPYVEMQHIALCVRTSRIRMREKRRLGLERRRRRNFKMGTCELASTEYTAKQKPEKNRDSDMADEVKTRNLRLSIEKHYYGFYALLIK